MFLVVNFAFENGVKTLIGICSENRGIPPARFCSMDDFRLDCISKIVHRAKSSGGIDREAFK